MSTTAIATRIPEEVANHVEEVANSPATEQTSKSEVLRDLVVSNFD
jgi:hypothetical protein